MRRVFLSVLAVFLLAISARSARADGDRVSFLHDITVSSDEEVQDAVCFLCSIRVEGPVRQDAVVFLGSIHANAPIEGDAVAFLGNISLGSEARVGGDCVVFLGSVIQHGTGQVGKDLVQFPLALIIIPILILIFLVYIIRSLVRRAYVPYPMPPPPPPMR
jgi:Na+-transporting methylmalonyl-CoA/oxaloacetate decarboxylase gamma subunit